MRRKTLLKSAVLVVVGSVVIGIFQAHGPGAGNIDKRNTRDADFSIAPGASLVVAEIPRDPKYGMWPRFDVESKLPVTIGFVPAEDRDLVSDPALIASLQAVRCQTEHVKRTAMVCTELRMRDESYVFFIRDENAGGNNYVHVHSSMRECINCSP